MSGRGEEALVALARARMRRALGELDYRRAVAGAVAAGLSVSEIEARLGISAAALEGVLARAGSLGQVPAGFSGASPLEICQRHAVGELSEQETVQQLSAWPYERAVRSDAEGADGADAAGGAVSVAGPLDASALGSSVGSSVSPAAGPAAGQAVAGQQEAVVGEAWEQVGLAVDGGLLSMAAYERIMVTVDPGMAWAVRAG